MNKHLPGRPRIQSQLLLCRCDQWCTDLNRTGSTAHLGLLYKCVEEVIDDMSMEVPSSLEADFARLLSWHQPCWAGLPLQWVAEPRITNVETDPVVTPIVDSHPILVHSTLLWVSFIILWIHASDSVRSFLPYGRIETHMLSIELHSLTELIQFSARGLYSGIF